LQPDYTILPCRACQICPAITTGEEMSLDLKTLIEEEFQTKVLKAEKPVLVEFGAPWCGPCKMLEPVLSDLAVQYDGQVDIYTINIDHTPELVMAYDIMGVPTVILFRDGQPQVRLTGYRPKQALEKAFLTDIEI
jgi:thioredoxin 1